MELNANKQLKLFETQDYYEPAKILFYRAAGNMVCQICQKYYNQHEFDYQKPSPNGEPFLRRLCDGDLVKL